MKTTRARGSSAKAKGLRFEREFGRSLLGIYPVCMDHPWFEFDDNYGFGHAQPDFVEVGFADRPLVCFECKLGDVGSGEAQLRELYLPILGMVYQRPPRGIVVTKHLKNVPSGLRICSSLVEALERARTGICVLHWREGYPL